MTERIIEIEVPETLLEEVKEPFENRDPVVRAVVREEVDKVLETLRAKEVIKEENDISVGLKGSCDILPTSKKRRVTVTEVFREGEDRGGAIDTSSETYVIEISSENDN